MAERIAIKNMVCRRCILAVEGVLRSMQLTPLSITLGEAVIAEQLDSVQRAELDRRLRELGFELLEDPWRERIERAKVLIIETLRSGDECLLERIVWSKYLQQKLGISYRTLSRVFAQLEGKTLARYIIEQKIELVKELIAYDQLSLSEISYRLGYSSVHHLSRQFKQVTGMTATEFRSLHPKPRRPLDQI